MYNKVILVGNLTRDIELRYSQSGMGIAKTALATSRRFTSNGEKKEEVCFIDVTFFGRSAEIANQYLRRGSKILVEGRLNFEQWVDQNGQKRSKHSVTVETMQMLDSKGDSAQGMQQGMGNDMGQGGYTPPQQNQAPSYQQPSYQQQNAPQQPSYQESSYQNSSSGAGAQSREMPSSNSVPVIDIDEDEIPF